MHTINIHEAKTHLSRWVEQVEAGEELIIARAGKPVARLVPYVNAQRQPRKLGLGKNRFTFPENFDAMHADEIRRMFEQGGS